ncbi:hypothetical protein D3C85_1443370 [compost metagenome]
MVAGGGDTTDGAEHHQALEQGQAALAGHGGTDKGEQRDQQQSIALQDAQRARRLAQHDLHVQRPADEGQTDNPQQYQKAPFPIQARCLLVHCCSFVDWMARLPIRNSTRCSRP